MLFMRVLHVRVVFTADYIVSTRRIQKVTLPSLQGGLGRVRKVE